MKLNELTLGIEEINASRKGLSELDLSAFGKHASSRLEKVIPAVKTHFFVANGGEADSPEWVSEDKFVAIRWTGNRDAAHEWNLVEKTIKAFKGKTIQDGNQYSVFIPTGRIQEDIFKNFGEGGNGDYVFRNLVAKAGSGMDFKAKKKGREITRFKTQVTLDVEIKTEGTRHSEERQGERAVSDSDIRASIIKGTEKILQLFIEGKIKENERFHISDPGNGGLNLIVTFDMNTKGTPEKITVVTAIRNKNYRPKNVRTVKI